MKLSDFSPLQIEAITLKKGNVLVSAGAGSGKTAVLIQRLYEIIKDGDARLEELLVLTFTNFAAKELKIRLRDKLSEDPKTAHLSGEVEASDITTFDAFALKIYKKYSYILDLDPNISIFDNALYAIKMQQIIEEVLNEYYVQEDPKMLAFIKDYLKSNDKDLYTLINDFARKASLTIDSENFINNFIENNYNEARFHALINEYGNFIQDQFNTIFSMIEELETESVKKRFESWGENFLGLATYDDYYRVIPLVSNPTLRGLKKEDYEDDLPTIEAIREEFKKLDKLINLGSREKIHASFIREKDVAELLIEIYKKVDERLKTFKDKHKLYTFSDVARFAYKIVTNPSLNEIISKSYKYILLDEYQDTSDIQEAFIQEIARDNLYMVGDIKQSIYGFRNANPKIFQEKFENYKVKQGGTLLNLVDNYRSRHEIVDGVNAMLDTIMTPEFGGAHYKKDHRIGFGNKKFDEVAVANQNYELEVLRYERSEELKNEEIEAYLIGRDIISKINGGYLVFDKKLKKHRPVTFSDFVILTRKKPIMRTFIKVFNELQIPLVSADKLDAKESPILLTTLSALKLFNYIKEQRFDNEFRITFASFARSFVIEMKDQELYDYLVNRDEGFKTCAFFKTFETLVDELRFSPPSLILERIIDDFAILPKLVKLGNVEYNRTTLVTILEMMSNLETYDMDLSTIIQHFDLVYEEDEDFEVGANDSVDNAVKIMTIHASKGLEFPIVYFTNFKSQFNFSALRNKFIVSNQYGLILPYNAPKVTQSLSYRLNYRANVIDLIGEEIRLLYVALTRPIEKMYILMPQPKDEEKIIKEPIKCKSYIDLLSLSSYFLKRVKDVTLLRDLRAPALKSTSQGRFELKVLHLPQVIRSEKRASKVITRPSAELEEVLKLGVKYHKYLELVDFYTKDLSFIENVKERHVIEGVLSLDLFHDLSKAEIFREYRFFDEVSQVEAVIDLFIVRDDYIELIDYKLSSVEDVAYVAQLDFYAQYLFATFKRPVKIYLLSIFKKNYRFVKEFK